MMKRQAPTPPPSPLDALPFQVTDIMKKIAEAWRNLSDAERQEWQVRRSIIDVE
jgi:hypothetical protein